MRKFTYTLFGFLICLAVSCSLHHTQTSERITALEESNAQLESTIRVLEERVIQLEESVPSANETEPESMTPVPLSIKDRIRAVCVEEDFARCDDLIRLAECESSLNPRARNISRRERSYGLYQINRKAHPHVTIEQAQDVEWSTRWAIQRFRLQGWEDWQVCKRKKHLRR